MAGAFASAGVGRRCETGMRAQAHARRGSSVPKDGASAKKSYRKGQRDRDRLGGAYMMGRDRARSKS